MSENAALNSVRYTDKHLLIKSFILGIARTMYFVSIFLFGMQEQYFQSESIFAYNYIGSNFMHYLVFRIRRNIYSIGSYLPQRSGNAVTAYTVRHLYIYI